MLKAASALPGAILVALSVCSSSAGQLASKAGQTELPIREVTSFKDGHTLVLRSGTVQTTREGDVVLTDVPRPIMGAFWVDESEKSARIASVTASRMDVPETRPVASVAELVRANVGRTITYRDTHDEVRTGKIVDVIERAYDQPDHPNMPEPQWNGYQWWTPPQPAPTQPQMPTYLVLIQGEGGEVAALPINQLTDVRFAEGMPQQTITAGVEDERLTLDLDWSVPAEATADVSLMYVERGLRWIPSYRVTVLDDETVRIELQATLVNELADLDQVTMHLAVGVPSFAFKDTPDPMGLNDGLADLGLFFREANPNQTGGMLSNGLMTQSARMSEYGARTRDAGAADEGGGSPTLEGSERAEDLFVYSVKGVTLAKGARMVLPLISYEAPAHSVYTLDLPASPPTQAMQSFNNDQQRQIANLLSKPKAKHVLRICNENDKKYPITTAPATVFKDGKALAQGLITYTAPGADVDLEVGSAVDIGVETEEFERGRTGSAMQFDGNTYAKVDIGLKADIRNRKPHPVTLEVTKLAFGTPDEVSGNGEKRAISMFSENALWVGGAGANPWWRWYGWPWWWNRLNGAARYTWTVELQPDEAASLEASWHYFWR